MADLDIAENLGSGADQDAVGNLRMAVAAFLAGAAKRHAVQDRDVIADHSRFAHHEAGRMVEEDALADARRRIDVGLKDAGGSALQIEREIASTAIIEPVCETMRLQRMETLEIEHCLHET